MPSTTDTAVAQTSGTSSTDQLNTSINTLIKLMAMNNSLTEQQLRAVRAIPGDLFQSV